MFRTFSNRFFFGDIFHSIKFQGLLVYLQCSFYFSEDFLSKLFVEAGFCIVDLNTYCRHVENHSRNMTFDRYNSDFASSLNCIVCSLLEVSIY